jgi:hypothetical protein
MQLPEYLLGPLLQLQQQAHQRHDLRITSSCIKEEELQPPFQQRRGQVPEDPRLILAHLDPLTVIRYVVDGQNLRLALGTPQARKTNRLCILFDMTDLLLNGRSYGSSVVSTMSVEVIVMT